MTSPRTIDDVVVGHFSLYRSHEAMVASVDSIFPSAHAIFATVDALDGRTRGADACFERNDVAPSSTVVATDSPVIVDFACNVLGAPIHVLPPSMPYRDSYDARSDSPGGVDVAARIVAGRRADQDD